MAERLTEKSIGCFEYDLVNFEHKAKEFNDYDAFFAYSMAVKKLGQLEDVLEKYNIESAEELDRLINVWKLRDVVDKMEKPINSLCEKAGIVDIEHDRDTWKKACELACEYIDDLNYDTRNTLFINDYPRYLMNEYYQQAKGNNLNNFKINKEGE